MRGSLLLILFSDTVPLNSSGIIESVDYFCAFFIHYVHSENAPNENKRIRIRRPMNISALGEDA